LLVPSRALNQFLPIVERELRVLAHHSLTWWRRVWTVLIAMLVLIFMAFEVSRGASVSAIGQNIFIALAGCGMVYVLFAGPCRTADCLSRERREGTLGLLFLTNLKSYDVVAGKMAATSLETLFRLIAALPLVAIPFLMGGVSLAHFAGVVLALLNLMFLSLSIGVVASAVLVSARATFTLAVLILAGLTLAIPFIGEEILGLRVHSTPGAVFYMFSPLFTMEICLDKTPWREPWKFWLNMGAMHSLAWFFLALACARIKNSWREQVQPAQPVKWSARLKGAKPEEPPASRPGKPLLDQNPVAWLEGRDRLQERILWSLIVFASMILLWNALLSRRPWPDDELVILWALWSHYVLCIWIAIQTPRRLADDKQSGALELLLSTPLPTTEIVSGAMQVFWRRFGGPLLALLLIDGLLLNVYLSNHPRIQSYREMVQLGICALIVFPLQAWTFARIGLYQGLLRGHSMRATFAVIGLAGLLPWAMFLGSIFLWELSRRSFGFSPRITFEVAFTLWTTTHLIPCWLFAAFSNWQLRVHFRALAAQSFPQWWQRLKEFLEHSSVYGNSQAR
jgi:ABC-type transport system involved in cytochrome c biogenesis permease component